MKVKEILALLETKPLKAMAKEELKGITQAEKKVRNALKSIGCQPNGIGKSGWNASGVDAEILEKDIHEVILHSANKEISATKEVSFDASNSKSNKTTKTATKNDILISSKETNGKDKDMKAEIQALIKGTSKKKDDKLQLNFYADNDIAEFFNNIPRGNKSELMNKIIRQYLIENDLM